MKRTLALCLCLAAPVALAETPLGPDVPFPDEPFSLTEVEGQPAPYAAELRLAAGKVTGKAPCNRFFGALAYDATGFRIENIGATRMACPDLDHEAAFFALLEQTRQIDRREGQITLLDAVGTALLHFTTARP